MDARQTYALKFFASHDDAVRRDLVYGGQLPACQRLAKLGGAKHDKAGAVWDDRPAPTGGRWPEDPLLRS